MAAEAPRWPARLVTWFRNAARDLPWRRRRTPYGTWVSEVMLQQTTVEVVRDRYRSFLRLFPDPGALARAGEEEVVAGWQGLGYYRRARGLHAGAKEVLRSHGGRLPADEAALRRLPGVGPYTARAILALAFDRPVVPVDGNVARVGARFLGEEGDVDRPAVRRRIGQALEAAAAQAGPARFAEALIELGALVCRPRAPACGACPLRPDCVARRKGLTAVLPRRGPRRPSVPVRSVRALIQRRGRLLVLERDRRESLLPGFWELPGGWIPPEGSHHDVLAEVATDLGLKTVRVGKLAATARHSITHHRICSEAWRMQATGRPLRGRFLSGAELDATSLTTETRKLLKAGGGL